MGHAGRFARGYPQAVVGEFSNSYPKKRRSAMEVCIKDFRLVILFIDYAIAGYFMVYQNHRVVTG